MKYNLDFFTQYGQFYIVDQGTIGDSSETEFWSNEALNDRLAYDEGILGVQIENDFTTVKGELIILNGPNPTIDASAEHIVEASIAVKSGIMEIQDCPTSSVELAIPLDKDVYRVRVSSYLISEPYLKNTPQDYYKIEIWKEAHSPRKVIKQFNGQY